MYDSTHGYNRLRGFRGACCLPFRPFSLSQNRELHLWEVPLVVQDCAIGNGDGLKDVFREVTRLLSRVREAGGAAALSWHLDRFSEPRLRPLAELYEKVLQWAQKEDALIGPVGQVMEAWENRSRRPEVDLDLGENRSTGVGASFAG
jgi:hypothetical protein